MKQISILIMVLAFWAVVSSCEKNDNDTTKPVIELHEPADGDTLFIGYGVHLEMDLSDDTGLKSYKIDIHSDFDGHGHTKSAKDEEAWTFTRSWDVSGSRNTRVHHHEIMVPATVNGKPIAEGDYHFTVYCTDVAGNESYAVREVVIGVGMPDEED